MGAVCKQCWLCELCKHKLESGECEVNVPEWIETQNDCEYFVHK